MFNLLILIIVLGILIFVHELGHFAIAKRSGMKVEEFGFGFPPRVLGIKKGETIYSLNAIPLGGFVRILGEDGGHEDNPRSFSHASPGPRFSVIAAGVIMNILLAFVLFSAINVVGARTDITNNPEAYKAHNIEINIGLISEGSPASIAGLGIGDAIKELRFGTESTIVSSMKDVQAFVNSHKGQEIIFVIQRGSEEMEIPITPRINPPQEEGAVGIAMVKTGIIEYPLHAAIYKAFYDTGLILWKIIIGFGMILKDIVAGGGEALSQVSGPVGIAVLSGQAARLGFVNLMFFTAIISLNLAILNILPIPPLDGGKLLFISIEKVRKGKKVANKIQHAVSSVGFLLLIALVLYATIKDVVRFF